ncbi:hypothetical protein [Sporosarcina sp. P35]|nr:hypothetical protein [Sporosarcina sp. P35]
MSASNPYERMESGYERSSKVIDHLNSGYERLSNTYERLVKL